MLYRCLALVTALLLTLPALADDYDRRIEKILRKTPLIDGHNDIPWSYRRRVDNHLDQMDLAADLTTLPRPTHTDIPRMRAGLMGGQFWSVYVPIREYPGDASSVQQVLEQIDFTKRMVARYSDDFAMAYTADDVRRIHRKGKIASLMGMEGGHSINNSLAVLRMTYELGARYMTLTHGKGLLWADSATDEERIGGLTEFGKAVVREMNRLGMLVDLSHVTPGVMRDAIAVSRAPVMFSHSSALALTAHPRNVPDDVLEMVRDNNGVVMVTFFHTYVSEPRRQHYNKRVAYRASLDMPDDSIAAAMAAWDAENPWPPATLEQVADHIDHVRKIAGINHIGLGGDYDGMPPGPIGLEDVSTYPALFRELMIRGYTDKDIAAIAGGNILRVMADAELLAQQLQKTEAPNDALITELDAPEPVTTASPEQR